MKKFEINTFSLLAVTAVALLFGLVVLVIGQIQNLESRLATLVDENATLSAQVNEQLAVNRTLENKVADLSQNIYDLHQPVPVQDPALFPISRVLARRGDTVTALAAREGTEPSVIFALNRWLKGRENLEIGQPIWIPSPNN
jgi:cell division protein FtsB